jgi:DNA invertase Pin-like site-specific DNA recombinase
LKHLRFIKRHMRDENEAGTLHLRTNGLLIGYAPVSARDQDLSRQREALVGAGCVRLFEENQPGARRNRPEFLRMLDHLRTGDVVTVTAIDRLTRSTRDLLEIAEHLRTIGAGLRSLAQPWADTTGPAGRMILTIFAGIADLERSLILERTSAGRKAAVERGVKFGRPAALNEEQRLLASKLVEEGRSAVEVACVLGVHRATVYRSLGRDQKSVAKL